MQYLELTYHLYEAYYWYAGLLLSITLVFSMIAAGTLYKTQLQLFNSVVSHHPVPIVQAGHVRYSPCRQSTCSA